MKAECPSKAEDATEPKAGARVHLLALSLNYSAEDTLQTEHSRVALTNQLKEGRGEAS